jgi:hypothetical protein
METVTLDLIPPARICGWCQMELSPGTQPARLAICPRCDVQHDAAQRVAAAARCARPKGGQ